MSGVGGLRRVVGAGWHGRAPGRWGAWRLALVGVLLALGLGACAAPASAPAPSAAPGGSAGTTAPSQAGSAPGVGAPAATPVPVPLSFTIPSPGLNYLVYYIGQEKGLYAAEGVDIEIQVLPANTGLAALLSGQSDATGAAGSAARAAATGSPVRVIMGLIDQSDLSLHAGPEIATMQDLRGKNVAITSVAGTPAQVARRIVQGAGLNPDSDVAFVQTQTPPQTYAALLAGGVPAAMLSPPLAGQAERAGYRVLAYGKDYIRSTQAGIAATEQRIAEQPDKLARLIRGTLRAIVFTLDREDETAEFVASKWELSAEDARATYRTLAEGIVRDGLTDLAIIEGELQLAGENVTGEQVVDYSLLRRVLAEPAWRDVCAEQAGRRPKGCR